MNRADTILKGEIAAYEKMRADLEEEHPGKLALVHEGRLIGIYDSFDAAAREAVHRVRRGPYFVREIGSSGEHWLDQIGWRL